MTELAYPDTQDDIRRRDPKFDRFNLGDPFPGLNEHVLDTLKAREDKELFAGVARDLGNRALDVASANTDPYNRAAANEFYTKGRYVQEAGGVVGGLHERAAEANIKERASKTTVETLDGIGRQLDGERAALATYAAELQKQLNQVMEEIAGLEEVRDGLYAETDMQESVTDGLHADAENAASKLDSDYVTRHIAEAREAREVLDRSPS